MLELDHSFSNMKAIHHNWDAVLDLDRLIPCVEGGRVIDSTEPGNVKAEIAVKMGAMAMRFAGTVHIAERDDEAHRVVLKVSSREAGGQGHANADVTFQLSEGGGTIHTAARITGKAASMGDGVVRTVLDALIQNFAAKFESI